MPESLVGQNKKTNNSKWKYVLSFHCALVFKNDITFTFTDNEKNNDILNSYTIYLFLHSLIQYKQNIQSFNISTDHLKTDSEYGFVFL
jgi:hypothetical protein